MGDRTAEDPIHVDLPHTAQAAALARKAISMLVLDQGLGADAACLALLLTSELVTNALRHAVRRGTEGSGIRLTACVASGLLRVEVIDQDPRPPVVRDAELDSENGRGLAIVAACAKEWGTTPLTGGAGKTVWFTLPLGVLD